MQAERYFGTYARFETVSKREAAALLGADNLVGDAFDIVFETNDGTTVAWMKNRFGALIGFFDPALSRQLKIFSARGWKLRAMLSFLAFTDAPKPGHYWGQAAVMCYDTTYEHMFDIFVEGVAKRLAAGTRPDIALGEKGADSVIESNGSWIPKDTVRLPNEEEGTVIVKASRKLSERLIEQSRSGNKGCYVASWVFLLVVVAAALFGLKSCGLF